jgi:hypothetical protein
MFPELCDGFRTDSNPHYKGAPPYMRTEQFDFYCPIENANY